MQGPFTLSIISVAAAIAAMVYYKVLTGILIFIVISLPLHKYAQKVARKAMIKHLMENPGLYNDARDQGHIIIKHKSGQDDVDVR